ncbi:type VI secretion system amidase immunity protein Tai4 [Dechloromonas denitrificans]|uniref:type VI secretion system amidase immunity protein Tai4 n=1 Tax=Dechloromonas denitrificans TaxID=281362 RepID=UPI001CF8E9EA|nr:type VI secretion system amidase immunity protein Tai4 [Dechloromonas denitrificans]UCV03708.1 type VI secretion system amidase immunity protein Tai4 [Dechloromonas denitrificans]UCV07969.1 type VI secretion system amidase immunity protein Tai4 [Dechloromonas denitrificans]
MLARIFAALVLCSSLTATAADSITATGRTNAENYKDRALAGCIAEAYKGTPAGEDAAITKSAFIEWTYYDDDRGDPATEQLVETYLRRDYRNPVEGYAGARFDLLKCIDMYHSPQLDAQVRQYVPKPDWVGDKPNRPKRK